MTVIWPDGTTEEVPDEIDPMINQFCRFVLWYNSLSKAEQDKLKENLHLE